MRRVVVLAALFLLANLALRLQRHPLTLPTIERERSAQRPEGCENPQALLIVDDAAVTRAAETARWSRFDCSYAWWSALEEEFGATACLSPRELALEGIPASALVAVRSRSVAGEHDLDERLLAWAEAGHLVVFDALERNDARELPFAWGGEISENSPLRAMGNELPWLAELPRPRELHALDALPSGAVLLLAAQDRPVAAMLPWGRGALLLCAFDFSRWLHELRQGHPDEDLRSASDEGSPLRANDFAGLSGPARVLEPFADRLLRELVHAAQTQLPLPRISPLPAGAAGLFLFTVSEEGALAAGQQLGAIASREGVTPTLFVTAASTETLVAPRPEIALQWNRDALLPRWSLGVFRPFRQRPTLQEQWNRLRTRHSDGEPTRFNRSLGLIWGEDYARPLRILEANEFALDSSYAPAAGQFGWVFGTARPYHPLDLNGRPFALLELPLPYTSDDPDFGELQEELFRASQTMGRAIFAPDLRATSMRRNPSRDRMAALLAQVDQAARHGHRSLSVGEYLRFRDQRLASRVLRERDGWRVELAADGLALEIPAVAAVQRLRIDGIEVELPAPHPSGWFVIPLGEGAHLVQIEGDS